jgi:methylenetetrahydrofolate reductase (NADPH)
MNPLHRTQLAPASDSTLNAAIVELAREASIELNVQDVVHLPASRALLPPGQRIYVSFLPKQSWQQTVAASVALRSAGFEPVPHLPVRLIPDHKTLEQTLSDLVGQAQVHEVLLIAGDYDSAVGPYQNVSDVLRTGALERVGMRRVSVAGHPEGHPKVALDVIRRAEREKLQLAADAGLIPRLLTQFFFEPEPFLAWIEELRRDGIRAETVAGMAGPSKLSTLFKFALRCGAGPSIRALGARPGSFAKLLGDHGPENLVRTLAVGRLRGDTDFSGIHLFCFGGFLRSCEWLHAIATGRFRLTDDGGFAQG